MGRIIICRDCGEEKEHKGRGLCKVCHLRYWQRANPEKIAIYHRRYHKKNREKIAISHHRYYEENREKVLATNRHWREENSERKAIIDSRWQRENPEKHGINARRYQKKNLVKYAAYQALRRAHEQNVANTLTLEQLEFERKIGESIYPGEKLHLHHLVPFSKGGGHTWGNIAFIPASLNVSIKDKLPEEVFVQLPLYLEENDEDRRASTD